MIEVQTIEIRPLRGRDAPYLARLLQKIDAKDVLLTLTSGTITGENAVTQMYDLFVEVLSRIDDETYTQLMEFLARFINESQGEIEMLSPGDLFKLILRIFGQAGGLGFFRSASTTPQENSETSA